MQEIISCPHHYVIKLRVANTKEQRALPGWGKLKNEIFETKITSTKSPWVGLKALHKQTGLQLIITNVEMINDDDHNKCSVETAAN